MRRTLALMVAMAAGCDEGVELSPTDPTVDCTGAEAFVAGMEAVTNQGRVVRIAEATPTPPDVGVNAWTLEVVDGSDTPVEGLDLSVRPWMPLHGHGLSPALYAATEETPGRYLVEEFDLIMPGLWEFTVDLSADGSDTALFALCAEG